MLPSDLTLAVTLTLNFQGQVWNSLYLGQKWSNCHETKSKHIDWSLSLKYDHRIWPWPWPWLNIQGQLWNLLYLSQTWFDCHKMKSRHIEWTECLNNNGIWPWKVGCKDLPDSNRGDFTCRRAVDLSSLEYIIMVIIYVIEYIQWPISSTSLYVKYHETPHDMCLNQRMHDAYDMKSYGVIHVYLCYFIS